MNILNANIIFCKNTVYQNQSIDLEGAFTETQSICSENEFMLKQPFSIFIDFLFHNEQKTYFYFLLEHNGQYKLLKDFSLKTHELYRNAFVFQFKNRRLIQTAGFCFIRVYATTTKLDGENNKEKIQSILECKNKKMVAEQILNVKNK